MDLTKAADNYCATCKKKKIKYLGMIMGATAILYKPSCNCREKEFRKSYLSQKELFDKLQTPFWKMMGAKPKEHDKQLERYLRWKGMSYGDWRRYRDYKSKASYQSVLPEFEKHLNKYGRNNAPDPHFRKTS
jgi:hypothetical protein